MASEPWNSLPIAVDAVGCVVGEMNGSTFIIGGFPEKSHHSNHLAVSCFDHRGVDMKECVVNTRGISNRAYHTGISVSPKETLLFGGQLPDGTIAADVISCSLGDEGFSSKVVRPDGVRRKGMSGVIAGPEGGHVLALFGGTDGSAYFNDVVLIKGCIEAASEIEYISLDGEKPSIRAFTSAAVCGQHNQYVIIAGGYNGRNALDDIWILDLSRSIPALNQQVEAVPTKGAKAPVKGAAAEEALKWCRLSVNLPRPSFHHASFICGDKAADCIVRFFGGINTFGVLSIAPIDLSLLLSAGSAPKEKGACLVSNEDENSQRRYGGAVSVVKDENRIVGGFLIGGRTSAGTAPIVFLNSDKSSGVTQHIEELIDKRNLEAVEQQRSAANNALGTADGDSAVVGYVEYPSGDRYEGEIHVKSVEDDEGDAEETRVPHGQGIMNYVNGSTFEGTWKMGKKFGEGKLTKPNGDMYVGNFTDDVFYGHGKYLVNSSGEEYEGDFDGDFLNGNGVWRSNDNHVYEGNFVLNTKDGHGTLYIIEEGSNNRLVLYSGEWSAGKPCGEGVLRLTMNDEGFGEINIPAQYKGGVVDGLPQGFGECSFSNGSHYTGQWRRGLRNGFGKYVGANGDEYDGKWVADQRCGKGVWKSYRGDEYCGQWQGNVPHGQGEYRYASGAVFTGNWENGNSHGIGKMVYTDKSEYSGDWYRGVWSGQGTWFGPSRSDGEVSYSGEWVNGLRNGIGTSKYSSGDIYTGRFVNDRPYSSKH